MCNVTLSNEEVFMATQFKDFVRTLVIFSRGGGGKKMQGKIKDLMDTTRHGLLKIILFRISKSEDEC